MAICIIIICIITTNYKKMSCFQNRRFGHTLKSVVLSHSKIGGFVLFSKSLVLYHSKIGGFVLFSKSLVLYRSKISGLVLLPNSLVLYHFKIGGFVLFSKSAVLARIPLTWIWSKQFSDLFMYCDKREEPPNYPLNWLDVHTWMKRDTNWSLISMKF